MKIETKFNMGDIVSTIGHKYIGKVIKVTTSTEKVEKVGELVSINSKVVYSVRGNESTYEINEENLYRLETAKGLEVVKGNAE